MLRVQQFIDLPAVGIYQLSGLIRKYYRRPVKIMCVRKKVPAFWAVIVFAHNAKTLDWFE